ncbi:hypothetical protein NDU88_001589 [Pleurodeles waltl]|uniref:Secreted protein n=1 Tax=Pleurodeles waltl TaxID=8319 RepID=A0AAV7MK52_PLEWA|nr:hypothetical protein NDU88_001589 [Pleurodeles waltl]
MAVRRTYRSMAACLSILSGSVNVRDVNRLHSSMYTENKRRTQSQGKTTGPKKAILGVWSGSAVRQAELAVLTSLIGMCAQEEKPHQPRSRTLSIRLQCVTGPERIMGRK